MIAIVVYALLSIAYATNVGKRKLDVLGGNAHWEDRSQLLAHRMRAPAGIAAAIANVLDSCPLTRGLSADVPVDMQTLVECALDSRTATSEEDRVDLIARALRFADPSTINQMSFMAALHTWRASASHADLISVLAGHITAHGTWGRFGGAHVHAAALVEARSWAGLSALLRHTCDVRPLALLALSNPAYMPADIRDALLSCVPVSDLHALLRLPGQDGAIRRICDIVQKYLTDRGAQCADCAYFKSAAAADILAALDEAGVVAAFGNDNELENQPGLDNIPGFDVNGPDFLFNDEALAEWIQPPFAVRDFSADNVPFEAYAVMPADHAAISDAARIAPYIGIEHVTLLAGGAFVRRNNGLVAKLQASRAVSAGVAWKVYETVFLALGDAAEVLAIFDPRGALAFDAIGSRFEFRPLHAHVSELLMTALPDEERDAAVARFAETPGPWGQFFWALRCVMPFTRSLSIANHDRLSSVAAQMMSQHYLYDAFNMPAKVSAVLGRSIEMPNLLEMVLAKLDAPDLCNLSRNAARTGNALFFRQLAAMRETPQRHLVSYYRLQCHAAVAAIPTDDATTAAMNAVIQ